MHSRKQTAAQLREEAKKYEEMAQRCRELADFLEQKPAVTISVGETARRCRELADSLEQKPQVPTSIEEQPPKVAVPHPPFAESVEPSTPGREVYARSKKESVYYELLNNGPATAKELQERLGFGLATIYAILQDSRFRKKGFYFQAASRRRSSSDYLSSTSEDHGSPRRRFDSEWDSSSNR